MEFSVGYHGAYMRNLGTILGAVGIWRLGIQVVGTLKKRSSKLAETAWRGSCIHRRWHITTITSIVLTHHAIIELKADFRNSASSERKARYLPTTPCSFFDLHLPSPAYCAYFLALTPLQTRNPFSTSPYRLSRGLIGARRGSISPSQDLIFSDRSGCQGSR